METKQATSVLEETRTYHHGIGLRGELTLERVIRYRAAVAIEWIKEDLRRGVQPENIGYTDLMVDGAPSPHQSDTTLRWLIDRLRS